MISRFLLVFQALINSYCMESLYNCSTWDFIYG